MRMGLCKILVYRQVHERWSAELRYLSGSSQFSCKRSLDLFKFHIKTHGSECCYLWLLATFCSYRIA